jgi:hypothetical protein
MLIAENCCAALFVSTVSPDSETAALQFSVLVIVSELTGENKGRSPLRQVLFATPAIGSAFLPCAFFSTKFASQRLVGAIGRCVHSETRSGTKGGSRNHQSLGANQNRPAVAQRPPGVSPYFNFLPCLALASL